MTKLELKRKILKVLKVFNGREEAIFDICWKEIAELESTNKQISAECHKLVDSLEKLQKENAELKKTVEHYRKEREFFIGEVEK